MKYCGNCGTPMEDSVNFCPNCGTASAAPQEPTPAQQQPSAPLSGIASAMVPTANLKEHFNRRFNMLGKNKWMFVAVLGMLFLEFIFASFVDCLYGEVSFMGISQGDSTTLWHEEYGFLGFVVALVLLGATAVAALPLYTKLPYQPWNLYASAGANGLLLIVILWMYLDFSSGADAISGYGADVSMGFTFVGIATIVFAVAGIVLSYLLLKPWKELRD